MERLVGYSTLWTWQFDNLTGERERDLAGGEVERGSGQQGQRGASCHPAYSTGVSHGTDIVFCMKIALSVLCINLWLDQLVCRRKVLIILCNS